MTSNDSKNRIATTINAHSGINNNSTNNNTIN